LHLAALSEAPIGCRRISVTLRDADNPATLSELRIETIIRQRIGFDGCFTDDIDMEARCLGTAPERSEQAPAVAGDVVLNS
jgi:beta-glucosidase-like glycosyl hydrolase